jgi:ribose 5-phosphate isomerase A
MQDDDKRIAAEAAVNEVKPGMLVGLGTGSTAAHFIRALAGRNVAVTTVATSEASAALARSLGLAVRDFAEVATVDLTVDGVDEVDAGCRAIKGAGGAMVREKIVAAASARMVAIADGSKQVQHLGAAKLPVEVLPFAQSFVERKLREGGLIPAARDGFRTDSGNLVLDCAGLAGRDVTETQRWLDGLPGVVGHGLFLSEIAAAYVADGGVVTRLERSARAPAKAGA